MGEETLAKARGEFEKRVNVGEFMSVEPKLGAPTRAFTTRERK
jgi:hypothetical protein